MEKMGVLARGQYHGTAQEQGQSKNKNDALAPTIPLAPPVVAIDTESAPVAGPAF